jgi:hypothetical protein
MKKLFALVARSLAPVLLLLCGEAIAKGTLTVTVADYNSAQVAANGNVVTVPEASTINTVYYEALYALAGGTKLESGSLLTVTLPAGFTFASTPTLYFTLFGGPDDNLISGGVGFQSATFQISTAVASGAVYLYPAFKMNAPALASQFGGSPLPLSMQATGNATSSNNDSSPLSQPAFAHAVGSLPDTITPGTGTIDLANPFYGDQFVASGKTIADSGFVAVFSIDTELNDPFNSNVSVLTPSGTINVLEPSDTANITIYGAFIGIGIAYASTSTGGVCKSPAPGGAGVYAGTVTDSSISFSGVPINTPVQICVIPFGVMWAANEPYVYTYSQGAGVTDYFGGLSQTTGNNFYTYAAAPTTVVNVLAGSPQNATVDSGFCVPLAVQVYDTSTNPSYRLAGIDVIFDAPTNGQSGSFTNGALLATNSNGIAASPFAANSTPGVYTVSANVGSVQALFGLTNDPGVSNQVYCNGFEY